jgi:GTP-binding protein
MKITSAKLVKSVVGEDDILLDGTPQVAFIGRSNVGKSTIINLLMQQKQLARSSPTPGLTKVINIYHVNKSFYLIDLPGYGFAQGSKSNRDALRELIDWYLLDSGVEQKAVVLIIDAKVGLTNLDMEMLGDLNEAGKNIVVLANKIDKIKKNELVKQLKSIREIVSPHQVIPFSAKEKTGLGELTSQISQIWTKK